MSASGARWSPAKDRHRAARGNPDGSLHDASRGVLAPGATREGGRVSEGGLARRGKLDRRSAGRLAGAAAVVVVLGAILGPSVLTTHPTDFPDATEVAARPSASHHPSSTEIALPSGQP